MPLSGTSPAMTGSERVPEESLMRRIVETRK